MKYMKSQRGSLANCIYIRSLLKIVIVFILLMLAASLTSTISFGRYRLCEHVYKDNNEDKNLNVCIKYPQIKNLSNKKIESIINDDIKLVAFSVLGWFSKLENIDIEVNYTVTLSSNHILSIHFVTYSFHKSQAYPLIRSLSSNHMIETGDKVELTDAINIDDDFVNSFFDWFRLPRVYSSIRVEEDVKRVVKSSLERLLLDIAYYAGKADLCFFLTEESFVISVQVRFQAGSYALFEADYSDIEVFFKHDLFKYL